jgi:hypothetical protein
MSADLHTTVRVPLSIRLRVPVHVPVQDTGTRTRVLEWDMSRVLYLKVWGESIAIALSHTSKEDTP